MWVSGFWLTFGSSLAVPKLTRQSNRLRSSTKKCDDCAESFAQGSMCSAQEGAVMRVCLASPAGAHGTRSHFESCALSISSRSEHNEDD